MKKLFIGIITIAVLVALYSCSSNKDPQFRIKNEKADKISVNVQTTGSDKFSINDIGTGQTTAYQSASEGNITVTAISQNESVSFLAKKNIHYTIVISNGQPPLLRVINICVKAAGKS